MQSSDIRVLLIQIRIEASTKKEEFESFVRYSKLDPSQFSCLDVFNDEFPSVSELNKYHCVFVGGASEASVLEPENYPFVPNLINFMQTCIDEKIPTFASCFGFQAAVLALGGEILRSPGAFEMGTYPIQLTEAAKSDPVFKDLPNGFHAVAVHREKAVVLPEGCTELGSTPECIHAFKVNHAPFWSFQFHPELDQPTLVKRLNIFKEKYMDDTSEFDAIIAKTEQTPYSNKLVGNFVEYLINS